MFDGLLVENEEIVLLEYILKGVYIFYLTWFTIKYCYFIVNEKVKKLGMRPMKTQVECCCFLKSVQLYGFWKRFDLLCGKSKPKHEHSHFSSFSQDLAQKKQKKNILRIKYFHFFIFFIIIYYADALPPKINHPTHS